MINEYYSGHVRARTDKQGKRKYQLVVEKSNVTGKRNRMYKTVPSTTTKREAEKLLREWINKLEHGVYIAPAKMTMTELFKEYDRLFISNQSSTLSPATIRNYKRIIEKDLDVYFKDYYVQQLSVRQIQQYVNEFYNNGSHSPKTVHNHFVLLKKMMDWAVASQIISTNPCENKAISLPQKHKPQLRVLQREDIHNIIKALEGTDMEFLTKMLFATGCRRGELIALTFDDWNMEESTLLIRNNRVYGEDGSVLKKPKMEKIPTIYVVLI